ncbi:MAG TPA: hypothetical protein VHS31_02820 [Tepidisphaeraceae bacterium]|nr:hypothetical protein [Tepidisphaeraceae bacterium]
MSDRERLIAEQAVETLRALDKAAEQAPWGKGLECMEACIHDKGFGLLRALMVQTASAQTEAKKKGSAFAVVPAAGRRSSRRARNARS